MKKFFKSGWFKFIIVVLIFILLSAMFFSKKDEPETYRTATVTKGDIEAFIEGSGTIVSSESRKVYAKAASEVLEVLHNEGDYVREGDVLVTLDSSSMDATAESQKIAIEQARLSINNIQKQISDLTIVANADGYVSELAITEGSYVTASMPICSVIEQGAYEIVLPFGYNETNKIQVGNAANVILTSNFATLDGVVTKVSEMRKIATGSAQVVDVTIRVNTTGYSLAGAQGKGEITVNGAKQISTSVANFNSISSNIVRAKSTGTVQKINVYEGKFVNTGDVIAILSNDDLNTSLTNAKLTLQNLNSQNNSIKDQLDNYIIKAPITGTITAQNVKVGDVVTVGMPVLTISNKDILEFEVPIDELDIAKIDYDQEVRVTIDALKETEDNPIQGKISKLPLEGTTTAGVTEYKVKIQIPGEEKIRISMNANAKIITYSQKNVTMVPVDSVTKENGESYVTVVLEDGTTERKLVELGERNVSYVEIKSGLKEGEKVIVPQLNENYSWF